MTTLLAVIIMLSPSSDQQSDNNGLPTTPPALPTYVVKGDGSRVNCTPNFTVCWDNPYG